MLVGPKVSICLETLALGQSPPKMRLSDCDLLCILQDHRANSKITDDLREKLGEGMSVTLKKLKRIPDY